MSQQSIKLLQTRRFLPIFITQFLEAFNDNFFKTAMVILITYTIVQDRTSAEILVVMASGVFIVPFFLFSAIAGQIADKFEKSMLVRIIKFVEIASMCFAALGFFTHHIPLLFGTLFLLGTHSAFFGPIKYSILPDHLRKDELITGNALVEASTFLAILLGAIFGVSLISISFGVYIVSIVGIIVAVLGLVASFFIPKAQLGAKDLKISPNIISETFAIIKTAKENKTVFLSILGISWFWLIGAIFLAQFPSFTKSVLGANSYVVMIFFSTFSIGIAVGSMLIEYIQKGRIDATYVPLGILGMMIFTIDLYIASNNAVLHLGYLIGPIVFLKSFNSWRILADIFFLSVCGGVYIVPLYAIVQHLAKRSHRSRIIAANNIINSLFMVVGSIVVTILLVMQLSITTIFLLVGLINFCVAIYICKLLPDALIKSFVCWWLKFFYRVKVNGLENYEKARKRSIILANHVSFLDGLLLAAFLPDKVIFAVNKEIAAKWWFRPILSLIDAFPLDPTNPMATKTLIRLIRKNRRCVIFPEGRLTVTGALMKIYEGPGMIADRAEADILPVRIDGAQFSPFSRLKNKVRVRTFPKITISILPPRTFSIDPALSLRERRHAISNKLYELMTDLMFESSGYRRLLFSSLLDAKKIHGKKHVILEDINRDPISYRKLIARSFILGRHIANNSKPKEIVGILLPNTAAAVICFFGTHVYGRIPALLNFSTGAKNIRLASKTACIKTVYSSHKFVETANLHEAIAKLKQEGITIIFLEDLKEQISIFDKMKGLFISNFAEYAYKNLNPDINCDDTAVILFTSGSEGVPKGVALSHANIQANCFQVAACVDFSSQDIVCNVLPMFHSFGLTAGTMLPIMFGIKVFLYPSPLHYRVIPELIYDINATILFGTDTFLSNYAKNAHPYDFYSVRYVFAGAEKLKPATQKLWNEKFGIRLFEGYGTTETSPVISSNTPMQNKIGTVGCFLPKVEYRLKKVEGIEDGGRLIVFGPNIMKGYLFHDNPGKIISLEDEWYDTGDIVKIDNDGYISIIGRAKRFAKIGGEMVSLSAIEHNLSDLWPGKLHAAISVPDPKKGELIVLVTEYAEAKRDELVAYFKAQGIAELSIPKKIIHVEEMFLLGSGKIDYVSVAEYVQGLD